MADRQYVVFRLGKERFCVDINVISGIMEYREITIVPKAPAYIKGIINLRGDIIPIVCLKERFNIAQDEISDATRILNISFSGKDVGFIVDAASEVMTVAEQQIDPVPAILKNDNSDYMTGIAKFDDFIAIILDLELIFSETERHQLMAIKQESS